MQEGSKDCVVSSSFRLFKDSELRRRRVEILIGQPSAVFRAWFQLHLERRVRKQKIFHGDPVKCEAF